jgi:tetratricopeptide (TPR) repeat protein
MENKKFKSKPEWKKLINKNLTPEEFQELCKDLAKRNGFYNVNYRGGGSDGGRDLEGEFRFPIGKKEKQEKCWFQSKKQNAGVNFKQISTEIVNAQNEGIRRYIIMSNSDTTPSCKDSIEKWNEKEKCQIEDWTGSDFIDLLWAEPDLCKVYFHDEEIPPLIDTLTPKRAIELSEGLGNRFGIEIRINKKDINLNNPIEIGEAVKQALLKLECDINLKALIYEKCSMFFFSIGQNDDAILFLNKSLDITPTNINALLTKGYILEKIDALNESNKVYEEIFETDENNVLALNNKAYNLLRQGELKPALELINHALELNPKLIIAIKNKIQILKALKQNDTALKFLSDNEDSFEKSVDLINEKVDLCIQKLDLKKAFQLNEKILKEDSHNLGALNNQGVIYEHNARYQFPTKYFPLALQSFEKVLERDENYTLGWSNKVAVLTNRKDLSEAEKNIDIAYSRFPRSPDVLNQKGVLLLREKEPKKAMKYFDSALKIHYQGRYLLNRAEARFEIYHNEEALIDLDRLLEYEPENSRAWYLKGKCLEKLRRAFSKQALDKSEKFKEKPISLLEKEKQKNEN